MSNTIPLFNITCPNLTRYVHDPVNAFVQLVQLFQPRQISKASFHPNTLSSLVTADGTTLVAAGGHEAEVHVSLHEPGGESLWEFETVIRGPTINNSVSLVPHLPSSSSQPRMVVSNNDCMVLFFDVPGIRDVSTIKSSLRQCGSLELEFPVNYSKRSSFSLHIPKSQSI